jgi:uncharacterized protein (DUF4415 family)
MRKEYDFASLKGRKNPYAQRLKKQVTLRLSVDVIELYYRECAHTGKKPALSWAS